MARDLVVAYYGALRAVKRTHSRLRPCLVRCQDCGIFFFTHPCNSGLKQRKRLRCPFGCREAHRKQMSTERSTSYYRGQSGRLKKRLQNGKRRDNKGKGPPAPKGAKASAGGWKAEMVAHVRMVVSFIEGRRVEVAEIVKMLVRAMRQHSLDRGQRNDYCGRRFPNRDYS